MKTRWINDPSVIRRTVIRRMPPPLAQGRFYGPPKARPLRKRGENRLDQRPLRHPADCNTPDATSPCAGEVLRASEGGGHYRCGVIWGSLPTRRRGKGTTPSVSCRAEDPLRGDLIRRCAPPSPCAGKALPLAQGRFYGPPREGTGGADSRRWSDTMGGNARTSRNQKRLR